MRGSSRFLVLLTLMCSCLLTGLARAEPVPGGSEKRIALVVGNAAYKAGELATPANDAGLVAQTLQAAGFDVVGARDLDEDSLRRAMRDFTDKASASGPDTVAFVYLAGYGLQLNGENYFAPVDAQIATAADVPVRALRLSDYKRQLAAIPLKARFLVFDAARTAPFAKTGDPLAGGLALTEAEPGSLVAFNAAPGTVGPQEKGPYGAYAQALVEMIREGSLAPAELFDRVRLRVSETTQGGEVPWSASRIDTTFEFFKRAADAPPVADAEKIAALRQRPLREIGAQDAYAACLQRDTLQGYQEFVSAYPRDALTKRVRLLIAARREAQTWRRTYLADDPDGYWSYLSRYPRGPHAWDARRRLRELAVALEPPPHFAMLAYDVPPPPPEEVVYVERPVVYFDDPYYDLAPPPPPPVFFLPPRPAYIVDLAPPPPVYVAYALPAPAFVPIPAYVVAPAFIAPPPNNVYFENIHNTTVINEINQQNVEFSRERRGPSALAIGAGAVAGAAAGLAISRVALPPGIAQKAALSPNGPPGGPGNTPGLRPGIVGNPGLAPNAQPGLSQQANRPGQPGLPGQPQQGLAPGARAPFGQPLPGQNGQALPQQANRPGQPGLPPQGLVPGNRPGQPQQVLPGQNGQAQQLQANRPGQPGLPTQPGQGAAPGRPAIGQGLLGQNGQAQQQPFQQGRRPGQPGQGVMPQSVQPQQAIRPGQPPVGAGAGAAQQQAIQQRQLQQQAAQQRAAAQQQQAVQQRQMIQQQQGAQQRQMQMQQQAAQQRQMQMQQQATQQSAAAQQQQQMMAAQQRAAAQQQQAAQQRQMMQQQMAQRQQQMARPQSPPQPRGNGRPCPPGVPCR